MVQGNNAIAVPAAEREMIYTPFGAMTKIKLTLSIVKNLVSARTRKGAVATDQDCYKFMMLCQARALNPFEGDAYLVGYDSDDGPKFTLITAHQAFLKRAEVHQEYDGMRSGVIVMTEDGELLDRDGDFFLEGDHLLGGWATVYFKNRTHPMSKRLKLSVFNSGKSRWKTDPAGMIVKCAEADALRSSFPTVLGGLYTEDESSVWLKVAAAESFHQAANQDLRSVLAAKAAPLPAVAEAVSTPHESLAADIETLAEVEVEPPPAKKEESPATPPPAKEEAPASPAPAKKQPAKSRPAPDPADDGIQ